MDTATLRSQMMQLWKETFHDSDSYIALIFDTYFDPEWVVYEELQGKVEAALLGIPYDFGWTDHPLRGLYLCGLATRDKSRGRGYMSQLIERICSKAADAGFAFTFLIPANDGLRKFYYDRNFVNATYRIDNRYTNIHNFENEYYAILDDEDSRVSKFKKRYFSTLNTQFIDIKDTELIDKTIRLIEKSENDTPYVCLRHSAKDIMTAICENNIIKGEVLSTLNKEGDITSVAFAEFDNETTIYVQHLYSNDQCSRYRLLEDLNNKYPQHSIVVRDYPEESERRALWGRNFTSESLGETSGKTVSVERVYKVSSHAQPYIMARILNLNEILEFLANWRSDCKYSILMKSPNSDEIIKYDINRGRCHCQVVEDPKDVVLSLRQLEEILFRKPSDDHLVMEAFGIPRFVINACLLLD